MFESFPAWGVKIVEYAGYAGIVFVMWYFSQKSWQHTLNALMQALREERKEQLDAMREEREKQREDMRIERDMTYQMLRSEQERDFQTRNRIFDQLSLQGGLIGEIRGEERTQTKALDEIKHKLQA